MSITLSPQLEKFIDEQVKAGRFSSTAEALEAGIARLMLDPEPDVLDQQDLDDLRQSLEQLGRGEVIDAKAFHKSLRRRYLSK